MRATRYVYDSSCLRSLRRDACLPLAAETVSRVSALGLRRHRGCRAGGPSRSRPLGRHLVCGQPTTGPTSSMVTGCHPVASSQFVSVSVSRHTETIGRAFAFGSMNIRSLSPVKLDSLLIEFRERHLDVLLLCETWYDADSVSIRRLRTSGFAVVERARPRPRHLEASSGVNHGGVAVVAAPGVRLSSVDIGVQPTTFECVAARVTSGPSTCVVVVLYRTGPVTASFF